MNAGTNRVVSPRMAMLAGALLLAGCGSAAELAQSRQASPAQCRALLQRFDAMEEYLGQSSRQDERSAPIELILFAQEIKGRGCVTFTDEIADLSAVESPAPVAGGPLIAPISLHVGVLTNMPDDARVVNFFNNRGVPARSIGSPGLGRRVYLGPFRNQGALEAAAVLAERAGFDSAYPAEF